MGFLDGDPCDTCAEDPEHKRYPLHECPKSLRPCGHHCNCSWIQDICHWCGKEFGEEEPELAAAAAMPAAANA